MNLARFDKKILHAIDRLGGKKLPRSIIKVLNRSFKNSGITFRSERYDQDFLEEDCIVISGFFYTFRQSNKIEVVLSFPKEMKEVFLGKKQLQNLEYRLTKTIVHEYRHKEQVSKKGKIRAKAYRAKTEDFELSYYMEYLGNADEIDAHAYETAIDFRFSKIDINKLRKASRITMKQSEAIWLYRKYFKNIDPKIWNRFLKKVYKNYARLYPVSTRTRSPIPC